MPDLRGLLALAEERGDLCRISRAVDPKHEIPALIEQIERQRKAYFFENVKGAKFPLVGGLLNRIDRYGWSLGREPGAEFSAEDLDGICVQARGRYLPPRQVSSGPVKDVVLTGAAINMAEIPVPTAFALDTGPFLTGACGISRNPLNGNLNVGIYRALVMGAGEIAINSSSLSDLGSFYRHAEANGYSMPIAMAIGVEPALLMAATSKLPPEESEYDYAGALQGRPIELVKCETNDLWVPANAEMIIEGRVDFSRRIENTLGEFAGQYGTETAPVTVITAITHRRDAMYYSIMAGMNPEHTTLGSITTFAVKRSLGEALRKELPQIRDLCVYLEPKYGSMAHIVLSIEKQDDSEPGRILDVAFKAAGGFFPVSHITKRIIVVDTDVNVHDMDDVEWALWTRVADAGKYRVIPAVQSWELERCARNGKGSLRLAIDATIDMADRESLRRPLIPGAEGFRLSDYLK